MKAIHRYLLIYILYLLHPVAMKSLKDMVMIQQAIEK